MPPRRPPRPAPPLLRRADSQGGSQGEGAGPRPNGGIEAALEAWVQDTPSPAPPGRRSQRMPSGVLVQRARARQDAGAADDPLLRARPASCMFMEPAATRTSPPSPKSGTTEAEGRATGGPRRCLSIAVTAFLAACSTTPQDMTIHGTVTLTSLNGVLPAQAYPDVQANLTPPSPGPDGITYVPPLQVNITADDGPGNYAGQPWNEADTDMTLKSSPAKMIVWTCTARYPVTRCAGQICPAPAARRRSKGRTSPWRRCSRDLRCASGTDAAIGAQ